VHGGHAHVCHVGGQEEIGVGKLALYDTPTPTLCVEEATKSHAKFGAKRRVEYEVRRAVDSDKEVKIIGCNR